MVMVAQMDVNDASIDFVDEFRQDWEDPAELFVRQVVIFGVEWPEVLSYLFFRQKLMRSLH